MSVRENIAANLLSVISNISSPAIKKATRQPFILDELSEQQYPAVIVQTSEENRAEKSEEHVKKIHEPNRWKVYDSTVGNRTLKGRRSIKPIFVDTSL